MTEMLRVAIDYSAQHGARIVEAYPKDPAAAPVSQSSAYTGIVSVFQKAGFVEVARRANNQPIMRRFVYSVSSRSEAHASVDPSGGEGITHLKAT